jgi:hypothetical protein
MLPSNSLAILGVYDRPALSRPDDVGELLLTHRLWNVDNDEVPIPDGMGTSLQGANLQQLE